MIINKYSRNGQTVKAHKRRTLREQRVINTFLNWTIASAFGICLLTGFILANEGIYTLNALERYQQAHNTPQTASNTPFVLTKLGETVIREVTAYNSLPEQTDSTPCISADGTDICKRFEKGENICATNAYELGTKLYVENFGECTVADRMNKRFANRVDLFFNKDKDRAVAFGKQKLEVSLITNQELIK